VAAKTMSEVGIDMSEQWSKSLDSFTGKKFAL